ncbi:MAG: hypothetical protein U0Q18_29295 [Bryobacteraceae bacterium]
MRNPVCLVLFAAALALSSAWPARSEDRSLVILFGPTGEESGKQAAHSVANAAHEWLKIDGAAVELRRPGISDGQQLMKFMQPKDLEAALLDAAGAGRRADLLTFLNALDKATYAAARHAGKRVLTVIVEGPSASAIASMKGGSDEASSRLTQTADFCRSNSVKVIVLDPSETQQAPFAALESVGSATGGASVHELKRFDTTLLTIAPVETAAAANSPASPQAATAASGLPVRTRLIKTLPRRAGNAVTDLGPMDGLFLVECPMSALQFEADERGGKYTAHARLSEVVRDETGKAVWQARKEVTLKESQKKLPTRKQGSLYYMRSVQLPAGRYSIEAGVEDLAGGKSGTAGGPLTASDSLPGFALSDALFVRPLNDATDRFEADQVLSYDGKALAPMLDPVFPADQDFDLQLFVIIYPDLLGAQPEASLEIVHNGQAVGRSQLQFNDKIRNTATEGGTMGSKGEQKHEFPFLATILKANFSAGDYEARITVRQGRNTITRAVPFRILRGAGNS